MCDIKRIEAIRWRLMVRYEEVVRPAYEAAVDKVHDIGGAYCEFKDGPGLSLLKLTPVRGSTRSRKTVRREVPRVNQSQPALVQLATVASPSEEELAAGKHFLRMKAWRGTYIRRIARVGERLINTVFKEGIVTRDASPRVLKINERYYPVRWGAVGIQDRLHLWWPHPSRGASLLEIE